MSSAGPVTTIVDAEVAGSVVDVRIEGRAVVAVQPSLPRSGTRVVRANGAALIPGLHDHHLHLLAMAAWARSVDVSGAPDPADFDTVLRGAHEARAGETWLRVVGYHERHGPVTLERLERLAAGRPVRIQHRSGAAWFLSGAACQRVGLTATDDWRFRLDEHLGDGWADGTAPDLGSVSRQLAAFGVTGVTDATPFERPDGFRSLASARRDGSLAQHVMVMGGLALADTTEPAELERGPVKVIVRDDALADLADLAATFRAAHDRGRPVAVHCVSRVAAVLALTAWHVAGAHPGDRIEHGSVLPVELLSTISELGLTVVTQPGFIAERGDDYLRNVDPDDVAHLYRCGSLLDVGIGVGGSTDAPFGPADPWLAIRTARDRATPSGAVLGPAESISAERALDAFLSRPDDPGGPPRVVAPGVPGDLCLLHAPLSVSLDESVATGVRATWIAGDLAYDE